MNKVLITGFEPFGHDQMNPSSEIIQCLDHEWIGDYEVITHQLPCVFDEAVDVLIRVVEQVQPQIVICLGQAKGRAEIAVERVAINIVDAIIPDNQSNQPIDVPIVPEGPVALWSTLPIKAIVASLQKQKIPAIVSQSAGTFVCNQVFYRLLHWAHIKRQTIKGGFIHVPALPEQVVHSAGVASMQLETMVKGIRLAIKVTIDYEQDIQTAAGTIY